MPRVRLHTDSDPLGHPDAGSTSRCDAPFSSTLASASTFNSISTVTSPSSKRSRHVVPSMATMTPPCRVRRRRTSNTTTTQRRKLCLVVVLTLTLGLMLVKPVRAEEGVQPAQASVQGQEGETGGDGEGIAGVGIDEIIGGEEDEHGYGRAEDACTSLVEAQRILAHLAASPTAHLDKKLASSGIGGGGVVPFGGEGRGWGDGLGWGHEGPLSTTFRLLPRLLTHLIYSPFNLISSVLPSFSSSSTSPDSSTSTQRRTGIKSRAKTAIKISKARKRRVEQVLELLQEAEVRGCKAVEGVRGRMRMFPPKGIKQDLPASYAAYKKYLEVTSDPEAQFMIGMFHATGLGGVTQDQGKALLYYTFAALQGYRPAEMALGYRHWAGIGVQESCAIALDYYEGAANRAYSTYLSGPPGGLTLPLTPTRLTDRVGGIYGPHASWASTGANAHRAAIRATSAISRGETEKEVLEYYQYHSDRDSHMYTVRLGRLYYLGSIYPLPGGIASGAEGVGEIPQSFARAREYFMKVARQMWPVDFDAQGKEVGKRKMSKDVEEGLREPGMVAAAFLGRMAMRGEGGKRDYRRARLWFERAAELGDREALNGLGIIHRDGLLVPTDKQKAFHYFQAAASQDLAEAQVNLAKLHLERGEIQQAQQYLEVALRNGSPFEAFHLLSSIHASTSRLPLNAGGRPGLCGVSVAWYKLVSEKGAWDQDFLGEAEKAWQRGEEGNAMVGWWIAGEMGMEIGQNNLGWLLEKGIGLDLLLPSEDDEDIAIELDEKANQAALMHWVRSAAQDNVDAMVKVGDYYYKGISPLLSTSQPSSPTHAKEEPKSQPSAQPKAHDKSATTSTTTPDTFAQAVAYYQAAADYQTSSMAYWNLGWMYENGLGVKRDWWLAKRHYDLAGEMGDGGLGVGLSVVGLYLRSWWNDIRTGGAEPGLSLFDPSASDEPKLGLWERIKSLFIAPGLDDDLEEDGAGWDDISGSGWVDRQRQGAQGGDEDRGDGQGRGGGQGQRRGDDQGPDMDFDDMDDLLETGLILFVAFAIMGLVWVRQRWNGVGGGVGGWIGVGADQIGGGGGGGLGGGR